MNKNYLNKDYVILQRSMFRKLVYRGKYDFKTKRSKQVLLRFSNKLNHLISTPSLFERIK